MYRSVIILTLGCWAFLAVGALGQQQPAAPARPSLDYEYFKTKVEPIFLKKRPGHARCISCHGQGTPMRLQPLDPGATTWTDEESRMNFDAVRRAVFADPSAPAKCRVAV